MTPMPPASAMAIASLASVTVSIAAEMIGRLSRIARVSCVPIFVALGMTALNPGRSRTSSNARPSGIELGSITAIAIIPRRIEGADGIKTVIRHMARLPNMGAAKFLAARGRFRAIPSRRALRRETPNWA